MEVLEGIAEPRLKEYLLFSRRFFYSIYVAFYEKGVLLMMLLFITFLTNLIHYCHESTKNY